MNSIGFLVAVGIVGFRLIGRWHMRLHQMLNHILKTELNLCQRECKPEFELVNLDDGSQEVRVALIDSNGNIWTKPKGGCLK